MAYLRIQDYYNKRIQKTQLDQITQNRDAVRLSCELEAQAEVISYLVQKYDVGQEFSDTLVWTAPTNYKVHDLYELDATAYSATSTYAIGNLVLQNGNVYRCNTAITVAEAFTISKWTVIGSQYALVYYKPPYDDYYSLTYYYKGNLVYYKNKFYKCLIDNIGIVPTDINQGATYWGAGVDCTISGVEPYNVPSDFSNWSSGTNYSAGDVVNLSGSIYVCKVANIGNNPINSILWAPVKWVFGDNRNQQLVGVMLDLCLQKIHFLVSPNNIPQLRKDNADYAIEWLTSAGGQNDAITADIPLLEPVQGRRIRWGSEPKNINSY